MIDKRPSSVITQDRSGCVAERFLDDQDESSIPHFIKFAIEGPDDWKALKERLRIDDPVRNVKPDHVERLRKSSAAGKMINCNCPGPYGWLRSYIGFENLSVAFYEYPDMIHEMVEHITEMSLHRLRQIPLDVPIDHSNWWIESTWTRSAGSSASDCPRIPGEFGGLYQRDRRRCGRVTGRG